jgi:hypothetical protein
MMELRQTFDPLDLEIIEQVYEAACAYIEAHNLYTDEDQNHEEEDALRKLIFAVAGTGPIDFDTLCDTVMAALDEYRHWARRVRILNEPVVVLFPGVSEAA